jgi:hypothetical protein
MKYVIEEVLAHSQGFLVIRREACKVHSENPKVINYMDLRAETKFWA